MLTFAISLCQTEPSTLENRRSIDRSAVLLLVKRIIPAPEAFQKAIRLLYAYDDVPTPATVIEEVL